MICLVKWRRGNHGGRRGIEISHRSGPLLYMPPKPPPCPYALLDNQGGITPVEPDDEPECPGGPEGGGGGGNCW